MCGIAGTFSFEGEALDPRILSRMNQLMTHRGPDAEGTYQSGPVALAMRRLKVIDLATGDQPIHNGDKTLWIIFNGEIYNYRDLRQTLERKGHRFYTRSDTEVILHQYQEEGEKCLDSLVGMFAFAIYDSTCESLFIARDRLGIKPLFYYQAREGLAFASEIKPILEVPWVKKKISLQAVSHFLSLNYLPDPWTPFENIFQLPPGHWMRVSKNSVEIRPYWEIPLESPVEESEEAALKKIEALLHRSLERRLIADVPVGAFLSGGLDSSTLVALMREHKQGAIKTFSVGFGESSYDETPYAEEVARHFGTEHHEILCTPEDVIAHLRQVVWHADNLLADQAALALYRVAKIAKEHVTVSLSGDGGDEVFVGYPTFQADRYHAVYSKVPRFLREHFIDPMVRALPASDGKLSFEYRAKKFIEAGDLPSEKAHYWWRTIFTEEEKRRLLRPGIFRAIHDPDAFSLYERYFAKARHLDFASRSLYADQKVWLAGNNLYKVDTMTMAHGLEARVPFLDHELVEYMARLPIELRFRGHILKYLLKKVMKGRLPHPVLHRRKAGWHIPLAGWMRGPLRGFVERVLLQDHGILAEIVERPFVGEMLSDHFRGKANHAFKIWGLLVLHHWAEHFFEKREEPAQNMIGKAL